MVEASGIVSLTRSFSRFQKSGLIAVISRRAPYYFNRDTLGFQKLGFSKTGLTKFELSAVRSGRTPYHFDRASLGFQKLGFSIVSKLESRKSRLSAVISGGTPYIYFLKILRADFGLA
jgi:hypothetical protein